MFAHRVDDDTTLTLVEPRDAEAIYELVDTSRMYLREWLPWVDQTVSVEEVRGFIERSRRQYAEDTGFQCCIRYKGEIVGILGCNRIDRFHRYAEIGYWLSEEHQGRGIMTRCCRALVDYLFREQGLHRVEIRAATENTKSRAIPERLGFTHEGTLREAEWLNDHYVDGAVYSLLRYEWES